jgi:hypothetical protein
VARARPDTPPPRPFSRLAATSALSLALAWLALATWGSVERAAPAPAIDEAIVLDVAVRPAGHPPAALVVVAAPPGSRHAPGTVLGSVPNRVLIDRAGEWRFVAHFADRSSAVVAANLPARGAVTLDFSLHNASVP